MLYDHGVEYLDLMFEFFEHGGYRTSVIFPKFFDYEGCLTHASREDVDSAYTDVSEIIAKALRHATQALYDEGQLHGFIAVVKFDCYSGKEMGWKARGEVTATEPKKHIEIALRHSSTG
jgi:hypothetical protein